MPPTIEFSGYVLSMIDSKRICVRVDRDHVERVSSVMSRLHQQTGVRDTLTVNVSNAGFHIDYVWAEISDLIGTHVRIQANLRQFSFRNEKGVLYKGVSTNATHIYNISA